MHFTRPSSVPQGANIKPSFLHSPIKNVWEILPLLASFFLSMTQCGDATIMPRRDYDFPKQPSCWIASYEHSPTRTDHFAPHFLLRASLCFLVTLHTDYRSTDYEYINQIQVYNSLCAGSTRHEICKFIPQTIVFNSSVKHGRFLKVSL
jgi:hypothetical protein